ncbi:hypothetical protein L195_g060414, partial [Trifolium pratense]
MPPLFKISGSVKHLGIHIVHEVVWSNSISPAYASLWWKDIRNLELCIESRSWLEEAIVRSWLEVDKWLDDSPWSVQFPLLFSLSLNKHATMAEMLVALADNLREENVLWRRNLFQWEVDEVSHLVDIDDKSSHSLFHAYFSNIRYIL